MKMKLEELKNNKELYYRLNEVCHGRECPDCYLWGTCRMDAYTEEDINEAYAIHILGEQTLSVTETDVLEILHG